MLLFILATNTPERASTGKVHSCYSEEKKYNSDRQLFVPLIFPVINKKICSVR